LALLKIIQKNLKLLIRSKSSALIIILGPLLVIFLVGIAFGNISKYSLNIGTYAESYTDITNSFVEKLREKEFRVQKLDTEELCVEQIKLGKLHTCIIFPPGLTLESDKVNEIIFYVDYSKVNLIWMILETLSTKLEEQTTELSLDLTTNLLNKLETTRKELEGKKPTLLSLETDNQLLANQIALLDQQIKLRIPELKSTSDEIKNYILTKIDYAKNEISSINSKIDSLNISNSTKNSLISQVNSINTYLYNIQSKIDGASETDLARIKEITEELDSSLNDIYLTLSATSSQAGARIEELQNSVDKIYNNLEAVKIKDAATIVSPITTQIKTVIPEKSYLNYLFPPLIVLVVMFISILLSTTLVMMEKHSAAYFRNFITPTRDIIFILATFLTNMLLVIIQLIIIIIISINFFKAQILSSLSTAIPAMLLITTFFTFIGMFIGYLFTSEETATLASISLGSIFLFLSDIILPLESMPAYIRNIARFNPFVIGENLLRKAVLFQAKFSVLANDFYLLLTYSAVLFIFIWISQKIIRKHLMHRLVYLKHKRAKAAKTQKKK
jgi:ABC-type multidrug transport system permease subunit